MEISKLKKANQILIFVLILISILYFGASVLIPITFAIFLAALVLPLTHLLEQKMGLGKLLSSFISTFVIFVGLGFILFLMIQQLNIVLRELVETQEQITHFIWELQKEIAEETQFSLADQEEMFNQSLSNIFTISQHYLTNLLSNIFNLLFHFLIIHIYVLLLLANRDKFVEFLMFYVPNGKKEKTLTIIEKTSKISHKYLWGRVQVMSLLAIMYFITFTAYDLPFSGVLIFFGAIITVIPYLGPFLSGLLPILVMMIFGDSVMEIVSFTLIVLVIQLIESYVLEPIVIGAEIQQSPLFVIVAVFVGGLLWGAAGLILFVPIFSILKIIFDNSEHLKPVGFLMGYETSGKEKGFASKLKQLFQKNK